MKGFSSFSRDINYLFGEMRLCRASSFFVVISIMPYPPVSPGRGTVNSPGAAIAEPGVEVNTDRAPR